MIPIKYVREYLEKDAAIHGEVIKKVYKFVKKHPWTTVGIVGGAVHILNEQRKYGIMNDQTSLLQQINDAVNKSEESTGKEPNPYTIPSVQPLA